MVAKPTFHLSMDYILIHNLWRQACTSKNKNICKETNVFQHVLLVVCNYVYHYFDI